MEAGPVPVSGSTFTAEDGTVSTVLPENHDPNYEPTQDELEEYATFIGIDPAKEPELLWIAKEGLRTPLPPEWRACQTNEDEVYYFNFKTGESLWDHPMDDAFKEQVIAERNKLKSGAKKSAAAGGGAAGKKAGAGSTKAIADSLFAKPTGMGAGRKNPPLPPPLQRPGFPQPLPSRLGTAPDVSDILGPTFSSGASSLHDSGSGRAAFTEAAAGVVAGGGGGLLNRPTGFASPTLPVPLSGPKDIAANIRRRVEEEYAPKRRQLSIDLDRKHMEEKHAVEEQVKKFKQQLDAAWEVEKGKSAAQRTRDLQRELKGIEESWAKRLSTVGEQVAQASKELAARRAEMDHVRRESAVELRTKLDAQRAEEVAKTRAELQRAAEEDVARVAREQEETLAELTRREADALSRARAKVAEEHAERRRLHQSQAEKMLAGLESEVARLQGELAEKQSSVEGRDAEGSSDGVAQAGHGGSAPTQSTAAAAQKRMADAEADAQAAVEQVAAACSAELTKAQKNLRDEQERLESELDALKRKNAALVGPRATPVTQSVGEAADSLTPEEEERLQQEEERLRQDVEAAMRTFTQQTDALVLRQQRQRGGGGASTSNSAMSSTARRLDSSLNALHTPLSQRGSALSPLAAKLQQLDAKHDERMRHLRDEQKKAFQARGLPNPRDTERYAQRYAEQQRTWSAEHPAPSADSILPKLEPVPRFMSKMGDMPEVAPPSPEEVKEAVATRLKQIRTEHSNKQEADLAALETIKRAELEALGTEYRDRRLREVKDAVEQRRKELAARRSTASDPPLTALADENEYETASQTSSVSDDAVALATRRLAALRSSVQQGEADMAHRETQHARRMAELEEQVASLDATIHDLTDAIRAIPGGSSDSLSAKPSPNSPLSRKGDDDEEESPAEPVVVTQPDYANYISTEEASAEVAALHARWHIVLDGVRRAIQSTRRPTPATTAPSITAASYATPIQARENPHHPLLQSPSGVPFSLNASTIRASPVTALNRHGAVSVMGGMGSGDGGADMSGFFLTPFVNAQTPPSLNIAGLDALSLPLYPSHPAPHAHPQLPQPCGAHHPHCPPASAAVMHDSATRSSGFPQLVTRSGASTGTAHAHRLARLHDLLRERRRELRLRQVHLESLREDWRRDMRHCKARGDRQQAAVLKEVKAKLEKEAHALNREVLSLKEAAVRLKGEEGLLQATADGGGDSAVPSQPGVDGSSALLEALMRVMERTERLETALLQQTLSQQRQSASPLQDAAKEPSAGIEASGRSQPSSPQHEQAAPVRADSHSAPAPSGARGGDRIGQWLQDQRRK